MTLGLLMVTMEPPAGMEAEFNDWYDTEHLPQRCALPGFLSGSRWVCLDGWPRWLALYDLASVSALRTPEYEAVSGPRSTPWSRRILPATVGRRRVVATQIHPGAELAPPPRDVARLGLAHYSHLPQGGIDALVRAAEATGAGLRLFSDEQDGLWSLSTFAYVVTPEEALKSLGAASGTRPQMMNLYAPYWRLA